MISYKAILFNNLFKMVIIDYSFNYFMMVYNYILLYAKMKLIKVLCIMVSIYQYQTKR